MTTRPDVTDDAIVDFDHHSDEFNHNQRTINAELRQKCPVAWNENYDGFWFLSSYAAVSQTARDDDTFSHKYEPNAANGVDYQGEMGVPRPEGQPALGIGEVDGALPPGPAARAGPVLLAGRRRKDEAVHGGTSPRVPRPKNRRRADGPRARLRQPGPGHPHHENDGPALRQLAALRQPLPLRHGRPPRQPRVHQRHLPSPRHDAGRPRLRGQKTRRGPRRPDQLPHPVRIRRPAPHRRTAAQHPLEPHRRRRRHHHLADRADPAAPGHPPASCANNSSTTPSSTAPPPTNSCATSRSTSN